MYLSRLMLNLRSAAVRHDLANCQGMHRTLLRAFDPLPEKEGDIRRHYGLLYRIEYDRQGTPRVYVQSTYKPEWSLLPHGYLLEAAGNPACKPVDGQYGGLKNGALLVFSLKANPTRKTGSSLKSEREAGLPRSNGRRAFLVGEEEQAAWLRRKGEQHGFEVLSAGVDEAVPDVAIASGERVLGHRSSTAGASGDLTFGAVTFHGRLRIVNRERFLQALAVGIGPGKAYGFGLLLLAPARQK